MVLVSVVKASSPPARIQDVYFGHDPLPPAQSLTRNFVPFHRTPSSDYQELHWRNYQYLQPSSTNHDELSSSLSRNPTGSSTLDRSSNELIGRYSDFGSTPDMPSHPNLQYSPTYPHHPVPSPSNTPDGKDNPKRWTFGGLFKRKDKPKVPAVPITIQFESGQRPAAALPSPDSESSPESEPRSNFLRRLSKKKKKPIGDGSKPVEGFLKVPPSGSGRHRHSTTPEIQSWETTKAPPNLLSTNNYSSSGSLSLSMEGSSSLSRESRVAAKEAVKARAKARRESILVDSSSGDEAEDEHDNNTQGSHSSLSNRGVNRRQKVPVTSKASKGLHISPVHRVSNSSPNLHGPGSVEPNRNSKTSEGPRWEARVVYTQETLQEDEPVFVRLPKRSSPNQRDSNGNRQYITETISEDKVITAGLRLPLNLSSSYPKTGEPIYANLLRMSNRNHPSASVTPPPPPRRDFYKPQGTTTSNVYRPVSCSLVDSYNRQQGNDQTDNFSFTNGGTNSTTRGGGIIDHSINNNQSRFNGQNYPNDRRDVWTPQISEEILVYDAEPRKYSTPPPSNMRSFYNPEVTEQQYQLSSQNQSTNPEPVRMSKLGFPVRKLQQGKSSSPITRQSPTPVPNSGVSEFWRRQDTTRSGFSPSPNFLSKKVEEPLNRVRIRSADSSPLAVPKHAKMPPHGVLRSNESISSLSSFSAETPSPNIFSSQNNSTKYPVRSRRIKSPEFKITTPTQTPKEFETKSACERLNVKGYTPSPPASSAPPPSAIPPVPPPTKTRKSPGKNLEDALNELEDMYKSLRLSDEDLLDRAERRDLPTIHQQLRGKELVPYTTPRFFRFSSPLGSGSLESLATTSGSGSTDNSRRRVRAPPMRRSGVPDRVNDDMAKRKYDSKELPKVTDPREVVGQSGSYLAFSPAFSPPVSPCPGELPFTNHYYNHRHHNEPDVIVDDVAVRNIRRANSIRVIDEPQPLFGVPLGPVTNAPSSDYLHSKPVEKFRPLFRHVKNPDIVKDDQAFRNLRKDLNQENNLSKDWTPRLFSPLRGSVTGSTDSVFSYNIQPESISGHKKLRALRSLSANMSHLINPPCTSSSLREEIGKWNSFTNLMANRSSRSLTPARSSSNNYREPSWVEQANLDEFGLAETAYRPPSPNSSIKKKFRLIKPKAPVQESRASPDPNAPRRPWTDIILQSYERENELERELLSKLEAEGGVSGRSPISEEDNDVFLDALPTTPSPAEHVEDVDASVTYPSTSASSSQMGLLSGQKDRRGSYVDPKSSSLIPQGEETKRKSWSEMPKQYDTLTSAYAAIAGTPKMVFTPLPAPRKVRQISLEGFSSGNKVGGTSEQELNELIDALVKEADTCGGGEDSSEAVASTQIRKVQEPVAHYRKKRPSRSSASLEKESKWQAAIAELESPSTSPQITQPFQSFKKSEPEIVKVSVIDQEEVEEEHSSGQLEQQHEPSSIISPLPPTYRSFHQDSNEEPHSSAQNPPSEPAGHIQATRTPRGILKKPKSEESLPDPSSSPKQIPSTTTRNCGVSSSCIPPWHSRKENLDSPPGSPLPERNNRLQGMNCGTIYGEVPEAVIGSFPIGRIKKSDTAQNKLHHPTFENLRKEARSISIEPRNVPPPEGMNGLRRLLMKETGRNGNNAEDSGKGIKKSPSTGTVSSYWSRISSNQPSFLRKLFEKVNPTTNGHPAGKDEPVSLEGAENVEMGVEPEVEPLLAMTVAEKATHFMKLEHNQRFSKWRNLDNAHNDDKSLASNDPVRNRFPNTNQNRCVSSSATIDLHIPASEVPTMSPLLTQKKTIPVQKLSAGGLKDELVVDGECNGVSKNPEPSKLSLKDRVHMFNRISSGTGRSHLNLGAADATTMLHELCDPPKNYRSKAQVASIYRSSGSSSSLNHHALIKQDVDSSYDNLTAFPLFRNHSTKDFPSTNRNTYSNHHHLPQSFPSSNPIPMVRNNNEMRSMPVAHSADNNDLSEDGEVSSGGMEVAEIISKSYENSPLVQKKSWGIQKGKPGFLSREPWRKYGGVEDNITHWSTATELPDVSLMKKTVNHGSHFAKVTSGLGQAPKQIQTSTSNLLPILTALSSSDDQLHDDKEPRETSKSRSLNSIMKSPPPPPRKMFANKSNASSEHIPDIFPSKARGSNEDFQENEKGTRSISGFDEIVRDGDPLVVKKHMPLLRRKSSGSKYKNPLRAFTARLDSSRSPT